jgi:hypothetical protein
MNMLDVSAALFGLAALGGIVMVSIRLGSRHNPPTWLAMGHGLLAAAGLTLLAWSALRTSVDVYAQVALVLFLLAAVGGMVLNLKFHARGIALPLALIWAHAGLAVLAFILLLTSVFGSA